MIMNEKYIFLLGGIDLEMLEIQNILNANGIKYYNKSLTWENASWKVYKDITNKKHDTPIFVGIELQDKSFRPSKSIDIDHHSFESIKPSSIEQVAKLLGVKLNRWQMLVAANDSGYIAGMDDICATKKEKQKIRLADKKAQGVTEEDEKKAKESIKKNKEIYKDVVVIKALTEKFSPITDLMYGKTNKLLIYTDETLTYYGKLPKEILSTYQKEIDANKAYNGGNSTASFFGLAKGKWTNKEIETEKNKILDMVTKKEPEKIHSHHIFLFPFRWSNWGVKKDALLDKKFKLETFRNNLSGSDWNRDDRKYKLKSPEQYNEYNYFYDYVREILYDLDESLQVENTEKNSELINHFEYKHAGGQELRYNIKARNKTEAYQLTIDSIILNIYSTGTGVLSFHLRNHNYADKEAILTINKFGRRLYVPFFDVKEDSIYTGKPIATPKDFLLPMKTEIPEAIWISKKDDASFEKKTKEDFEQYKDNDYYKNGPFNLPKFITGLFPKNFFLVHEKQGYLEANLNAKNKKYKVYLRPVLDDRMHIVSWYGNTELVDKLKTVYKKGTKLTVPNAIDKVLFEAQNYYTYEKDDFWYNYIYTDTDPMHKNRFERQQLLHEQTYSRWVEWGTLYGMSRYSFVMLTGNFSDTPNYLVRHLQSMYYKMAELSLLQRATVLSYSGEVTHVSNLISNNDEKVLENIECLYKHYILFVNKIFFREITAQEQGIEMYDMMQKTMRIPPDVKDLDNEIEELNTFATMLQEKKAREETEKHTWLATIFLPAMIISGILGMNVMPQETPSYLFNGSVFWPFWIIILILVILTIVFRKLFKKYINTMSK